MLSPPVAWTTATLLYLVSLTIAVDVECC